MADTATAERLTGYLVGGISPFVTKHKLSVLVELITGDFSCLTTQFFHCLRNNLNGLINLFHRGHPAHA
jgi:hypothetical protein